MAGNMLNKYSKIILKH